MKKSIILLTVLINSILCLAQNIPNGDLETWIPGAGGWYEQPEGWITLNNQIMESAFKDFSPCEGELGLTVKPLAMTESLMGTAHIDFPISAIPASLDFCVKTNVYEDEVWTDTCRVIISFWNGDIEFYSEEWMSTSSIDEWTNVSIPLNQIEPFMDGCRIEVQASYPGIGLGSGSTETWISVDDFTFDAANAITETVESTLEIYPNPSENNLVHLSSDQKLGSIQVIDLIGQVVFEDYRSAYKTTLELNIPSGIYFVKTQDQTRKLILR